jgi:cytochrome c oxidase assembly protein subunit 15
VQFDHRLLATITACTVLATVVYGLRTNWRDRLPQTTQLAFACMAGAVLLQYALGVATLLSGVRLQLAISHQACAVLLLATALSVTHSLRGAR